MRASERKSRFLRLIQAGGRTVAEVLAEMGMRPATLARWVDEDPAFAKRWDAVIRCLALTRATDEQVRANLTAAAAPVAAGGAVTVGETDAGGGETGESVTPIARHGEDRGADVARPVMSERDRLIELRGPAAGEAYDRLARLRAETAAASSGSGVGHA